MSQLRTGRTDERRIFPFVRTCILSIVLCTGMASAMGDGHFARVFFEREDDSSITDPDLDNTVDDREQQLIDQETDSGQWGLPDQIVHSERGRIPEDTQTLLQRAEDEQVRQALARGCSRETIGEVIGVTPRTTWDKEKRANAYDFPLDAVSRTGEAGEAAGSESAPADTPQGTDQQQLDTVATMEDGDPVADAAISATDGGTSEDAVEPLGSDPSAVRAELMTAIEALQAAKESLSAD